MNANSHGPLPVAAENDDIIEVAALATAVMSARREAKVLSGGDPAILAERLAGYDFAAPLSIQDVAGDVVELLTTHAVRSDHPRYFGLFNPPALASAVVGDLIAATVNPQLAVWGHAPAAAEIERKLVRFMGSFIWNDGEVAGTFTSGGTEANHTALLSALARRYPGWAEHGVRSLSTSPAIYASSESHLAWIKIARSTGLGSDAVRLVTPADGLSLTAADLRKYMDEDRGYDPILVVATAGTTAHGEIDDLDGIAAVASEHGAHYHVDAAWAGGGVIHPAVRAELDGIQRADSVTLDPHKWLAVPMGCGMFLARDWHPLEQAFAVSTGYMPSASLAHRDAYIHSLQWSRRFIGLKLFMALASEGLPGYRAMIERQIDLAARLRQRLERVGWTIRNRSRLPLVCFTPGWDSEEGDEEVRRIEQAVVASGLAWISTVRLRGELVLRACITSFETDGSDVDELVRLLQTARGRSGVP